MPIIKILNRNNDTWSGCVDGTVGSAKVLLQVREGINYGRPKDC